MKISEMKAKDGTGEKSEGRVLKKVILESVSLPSSLFPCCTVADGSYVELRCSNRKRQGERERERERERDARVHACVHIARETAKALEARTTYTRHPPKPLIMGSA
jgi:hypothetical protein